MDRIPASERTREGLKALIEGHGARSDVHVGSQRLFGYGPKVVRELSGSPKVWFRWGRRGCPTADLWFCDESVIF